MIDSIQLEKLENVAPEYDLRDLLEAGCHFGHEASAWSPRMAEWIYTKQDGIHIFDLEKTAQQLHKAYNYLHHLGQEGKSVIFVGTKRQAREILKTKAADSKVNWITSRWLGGLLTNWQQVSKSLKRMLDIEKGLESGKYDKYTKYEQTQLEKEAGRLARFFDGLRTLRQVPDAIVVLDPNKEKIAVTEAKMMGVTIIGVVDTNTNPENVDLVIPANDDGRNSIEFLLTQLIEAYDKGQGNKTSKKEASKEAPKKKEAPKSKKEAASSKTSQKTTKTTKEAKKKKESK